MSKIGWVFGVLKHEHNIDTEGMTPEEAFEKLKELEKTGSTPKNITDTESEQKRVDVLAGGAKEESIAEIKMQEQKYYGEIQKAYKASVNDKIVSYVQGVMSGKIKDNLELVGITEREASDVKEKTGVNVTGFTRWITPNSVSHINKKHGEKGLSDTTMKDVNDIARIEYVIINYDNIELSKRTSKNYKNSDGTPAKQIVYSKRINGNYYIAEAVPDSKAKRLIIVSAYKSAK